MISGAPERPSSQPSTTGPSPTRVSVPYDVRCRIALLPEEMRNTMEFYSGNTLGGLEQLLRKLEGFLDEHPGKPLMERKRKESYKGRPGGTLCTNCGLCPYTGTSQKTTEHVISKHFGLSLWRCDVGPCDVSCRRQADLHRHRQTHDIPRPWGAKGLGRYRALPVHLPHGAQLLPKVRQTSQGQGTCTTVTSPSNPQLHFTSHLDPGFAGAIGDTPTHGLAPYKGVYPFSTEIAAQRRPTTILATQGSLEVIPEMGPTAHWSPLANAEFLYPTHPSVNNGSAGAIYFPTWEENHTYLSSSSGRTMHSHGQGEGLFYTPPTAASHLATNDRSQFPAPPYAPCAAFHYHEVQVVPKASHSDQEPAQLSSPSSSSYPAVSGVPPHSFGLGLDVGSQLRGSRNANPDMRALYNTSAYHLGDRDGSDSGLGLSFSHSPEGLNDRFYNSVFTLANTGGNNAFLGECYETAESNVNPWGRS